MMRFGTLGYCMSEAAVSVVAGVNGTTSGCTPTKLGYNLDYNLFMDGAVWGTGDVDIRHSVVKGLTYMLFLQPLGEQ